MNIRIENLSEKKLVGMKLCMSMESNLTAVLWQSFMPRRKEILNPVGSELISLQIYPENFDFTFANYTQEFVKWAAVEVPDFANLPEDMETFILKAGLYAVFEYTGSSNDSSVFHYIFKDWLPNSGYALANNPHFEVLGEKYKNNAIDSEEEIWIPIVARE